MEHTPKVNLQIPGAIAIARDQVGGSLHAAILLYRLKHFFNPANNIKKLKRKIDGVEREWIAMSREKWAFEAGLTVGELKNAALPHLRKRDFVTIMQAKVTPKHPKTLWISLDLVKLNAANTPADMLPFFPPGEPVFGKEGQKAYPYEKAK